MQRFIDKVVLTTGAAEGMGRAFILSLRCLETSRYTSRAFELNAPTEIPILNVALKQFLDSALRRSPFRALSCSLLLGVWGKSRAAETPQLFCSPGASGGFYCR